jgi:hypothetical protein
MVTLQHTALFLGQFQRVAVLVELVDALEEPLVEQDACFVRGKPRRHFARQLLHFGCRVRRLEIVEHGGDAVQILAAFFQGDNGVGKARLGGIFDDRLDLTHMRPQRCFERRLEMTRLDFFERRKFVGAAPARHERIGALARRSLPCAARPDRPAGTLEAGLDDFLRTLPDRDVVSLIINRSLLP